MRLKLVKSGHNKPCSYTDLSFDIGAMGYDWLADCCDELGIDYSGMSLEDMRAAILAKSYPNDEKIDVEKLHLDAAALYLKETQVRSNPGSTDDEKMLAKENRKMAEFNNMQKDFSKNNRSKVILEWGGALTGLIGTFLLSLHSQYSGYGFIGYLFSNFFWIVFGYRIKAWGLVSMQAGYTVLSLFGIYSWLF